MRPIRLFILSLAALPVLAGGCHASEPARGATHASPDTGASGGGIAHGTAATPIDTSLARRVDHARIQGSPEAPVWVVEVSDFQCPFCKRWHEETYPIIKKEYVETGKVRLAYVNFPLPAHKNAWPAAEAAMCAAAQNKFWEMHDRLFETQDQWGPSGAPLVIFDSLATGLGLDIAHFNQCVTSQELKPTIQGDIDRAEQTGVEATPTFIIGSQVISGAQPPDVFRKAIDEALAKQRKG